MAVGIGQRCLVRVKITDVELRNARGIVANVVSPQGEECQEVSFDEVSGLVYVAVDVNSAGSWSMWLGVRYDKQAFYTPAFVFAEVEGEATPCDAPYIVDVEVSGESVTVTPPKIDVEGEVSREEFDALTEQVAGKVDKEAGKGLSANDYTDADKNAVQYVPNLATKEEVRAVQEATAQKADTDGTYPNMTVGKANGVVGINQVQEALTLTTKANGNIVIGNLAGQSKEFMPATPSGDPMHYAYENAGAVWNASTGYWELNGLNDISNAEIRKTYAQGYHLSGIQYIVGWFTGSDSRTNINRCYWSTTGSLVNLCPNSISLIVFDIGTGSALPTGMNWAFYGNSNMIQVKGVISGEYCTDYSKAFGLCSSLKLINIHTLKTNISFADSPLLTKESLLYMIDNCASGVSFTITLHPDVYEKCQEFGEWFGEIEAALTAATDDKNTSVTLASA